jgi:uncharacterized protein YndB with AHSA1/START domain
VEGTVRELDGRYELRFERRLDHPVRKVWAALTESERLAEWLAEADLELVEGGRVELCWQNTDEHGNRAVARGRITRLEPPRLLEIDTDIHGLLRWELREDGDGCLLTFTNATPAPEDMLAIVLAGWHIHLDHLAHSLVGHPVNWPTWAGDHLEHWKELRNWYAEELGSAERRTGS